MSDSSIGIVGRWFRERRDLARARASAQQPGRPESVEASSWRGLDTTTRDLAVEASLLGQLGDALKADTEPGQRAARWGERDRVGGEQRIARVQWANIEDGQRADVLVDVIERMLVDAVTDHGLDLSDLTITVGPTEPTGTIGVRVEGVRS